MEKSWFSHTGMEGGLSLSLAPDCIPFLCLPFFVQPAVCRRTGGGLLVVIYIHSLPVLYCCAGKMTEYSRWMCISLLYKAVNASDFQTSLSQQQKLHKVFSKPSDCGTNTWGYVKTDCLLDYDFTCQCPHWTTENTFTFTHSCSFILLRPVMLDNSFCHHPISALCNSMSCIKGKQNTENNLSKSWTFCPWKLKCYIFSQCRDWVYIATFPQNHEHALSCLKDILK